MTYIQGLKKYLIDNVSEQNLNLNNILSLIDEYELKNGSGKKVIPFGKYKGKTIQQVFDLDRKYLEWLYQQEFVKKFKDVYNGLRAYIV